MLSQTLSLCYKTRFWPEATNADGDTALHIAARCQNVSGQEGFKWGVEKREQFFGFPWEERITNDGWRFLDGEVMYDKQINYLQFKMQNYNIMVGQTIAECLSCCTWLYVFLGHMLWCILYIYVYIYIYLVLGLQTLVQSHAGPLIVPSSWEVFVLGFQWHALGQAFVFNQSKQPVSLVKISLNFRFWSSDKLSSHANWFERSSCCSQTW